MHSLQIMQNIAKKLARLIQASNLEQIWNKLQQPCVVRGTKDQGPKPMITQWQYIETTGAAYLIFENFLLECLLSFTTVRYVYIVHVDNQVRLYSIGFTNYFI